VHDAAAIPLEVVAVGMGEFRITASAGAVRREAKVGEYAQLWKFA